MRKREREREKVCMFGRLASGALIVAIENGRKKRERKRKVSFPPFSSAFVARFPKRRFPNKKKRTTADRQRTRERMKVGCRNREKHRVIKSKRGSNRWT